MASRLCVVGAGPKAAAIAARAAAIRTVDPARPLPEIVIVEKEAVGAAWAGSSGFSSGLLTLCSPGEKDVGFPYLDVRRPARRLSLGEPLFQLFSWQSYLVARGRYAEWVDRGRDHPIHAAWADYLRWVIDRAGQEVVPGTVTAIEPSPQGGWLVRLSRGDGRWKFSADAVVLTGAGQARQIPIDPAIPDRRVYDAETFWANRGAFQELQEATIAVLGDGGGAGTIVAWLADRLMERRISIVSISPTGTLLPRGDGYAERRWFSDPAEWLKLSAEHRRKLLERTEAGVVSLRIKSVIDRAHNVEYRAGRAWRVDWDLDELRVELTYDGEPVEPVKADYVISAIGFDPWSLLDPVRTKITAMLRDPRHGDFRERVENTMRHDLSFEPRLDMPGGLHVPVLAGFAQGPGMGTLGSLGLMASRVLDPYVG